MSCAPRKLQLQSLGELRLRYPMKLALRVYEVEGCGRERTYFCRAGSGCASELSAVGVSPMGAAGVRRALHVRRTTSRARCPSDDERLVQESRTLYRFEACDGSYLVHCRQRGCEVFAGPL